MEIFGSMDLSLDRRADQLQLAPTCDAVPVSGCRQLRTQGLCSGVCLASSVHLYSIVWGNFVPPMGNGPGTARLRAA